MPIHFGTSYGSRASRALRAVLGLRRGYFVRFSRFAVVLPSVATRVGAVKVDRSTGVCLCFVVGAGLGGWVRPGARMQVLAGELPRAEGFVRRGAMG